MNQKANEPQPKSQEQIKLEHKYEVLETGDVKVTQEQIIEFTWTQREFLTLHRGNEKALEDTRKIMGDEYRKTMEEQEKSISKQIEIMKPITEESERLGKINYEKTIMEGMTKQFKSAIAAEEFSANWWKNIWKPGKEERKKIIIDSLNAEEKKLYEKAVVNMKKEGIIE